jgi:hypothetical protein
MQKVRLPYWTLLVLKLLVYIDAGLFKAQFEEAQKTKDTVDKAVAEKMAEDVLSKM